MPGTVLSIMYSHSHTATQAVRPLLQFYGPGNLGSEKLSNFPKVTQLMKVAWDTNLGAPLFTTSGTHTECTSHRYAHLPFCTHSHTCTERCVSLMNIHSHMQVDTDPVGI